MVEDRGREPATGKGEVAAKDHRPRLASNVPAGLTETTATYARHVGLATLGVLLLVSAYLALTGWFLYTCWRLAVDVIDQPPPYRGAMGLALFVASALTLLLIAGLFSIARRHPKDGVELTPEEQPELFDFLHELADAAGAPRPKRIFVSARVNAAVFYDLSLLNLFLPARKDLELGLGLVNALDRSELAAVVGHEFGHFAQRSMALGRWVYLSRQVVERVILQRSKLEQLLVPLTYSRIFWLGALPRLMIWSVRSLLGKILSWVEGLQRALGREMEFQADLVAVSLTGSDALVHALHRLGPADEAWTVAAELALQQMRTGRIIPDLFALQARVIERTRVILNDATHGASPTLPEAQRATHRVFQAKLADAPSMWSSHPANRDREDNAKRRYVPAELDSRPAWGLFRNAEHLKQRVTRRFLTPKERASALQAMSPEAALDALNARFDRACLSARYQGVYFGRSPVLHVYSCKDLYGPLPPLAEIHARLANLYPPSLATELRELRDKLAERDQLRAHFKELSESRSVVQHQGRSIGRGDLRERLKRAERELRELRNLIEQHDQTCRTVHLAIAQAVGDEWAAYLENLAKLLWYAAHSRRALEHHWGLVEQALAVHTEGGQWLDRQSVEAIERAGQPLRTLLAQIFEQRREVQLPPELRRKLYGLELDPDNGIQGVWARMLPNALPELPQLERDPQGFATWFESLERSVGMFIGALRALEDAALDSLLEVESGLRHAYETKLALEPAPPPPGLPGTFSFVREPDETMDSELRWWLRPFGSRARPYRLLRLAVAATVFCTLLGFTAAPIEALDLEQQLQAQLLGRVPDEHLGRGQGQFLNRLRDASEWELPLGLNVFSGLHEAYEQPSPAATEPQDYEPYVPSQETTPRVEAKASSDPANGTKNRSTRLDHGSWRLDPVGGNALLPDNLPNAHASDPIVQEAKARNRELMLSAQVESYPPGVEQTSEVLQLALKEKRRDLLERRLRRYPGDPETLAALAALDGAH